MNSAKSQDIKSMYRNQLLFYTQIMKQQKEIKESILLTIAPGTIKYQGINLTKDVKDLYDKNYRKLMKGIEETQREKHSVLVDWKNKYC